MSLVLQWLRLHLPVQGARVQSLIRELRSNMTYLFSHSHAQFEGLGYVQQNILKMMHILSSPLYQDYKNVLFKSSRYWN